VSIFNGNIYFNIALVPAYRDALYLIEERNKGRPTTDRWKKERERMLFRRNLLPQRIVVRGGDLRGSGRRG